MLSEPEKRELKALAKSQTLREDFELLRHASPRKPDDQLIDAYLSFLACLRRMQARQLPAPSFPIYTNVRL
jgi:hypothetical protein